MGPPQLPPNARHGTTAASLVGRENGYTCSVCSGVTMTIHVDDGVTPAFIDCRASPDCKGVAGSMFYPEGPRPAHLPDPAWEWYRPTRKQTRRLDRKYPGVAQHVRAGGLWLRPISRPRLVH